MSRLEGKVAIVTGASSGIGKATAELFAKEGAKVIVADINESDGHVVVDEIKSKGHEASFIKLDVTSESSWENVTSQTEEKYGKLNILINNAGTIVSQDFEESTLEDWNKVMDVNSTGVFLGIKHCVQLMKKNGEMCSIVNRSSIDGLIGEGQVFAYCASKGAVTVMTKAAALTCGEKGYKIRVNSVHPAFVKTPIIEEEVKGYGVEIEEYLADAITRHPIGYIGEPIDIAYMDLYLASDESKFVTGASFLIDGGYTAQ
ncbi:glucose 1-dehydrogenase [Bacillus sp. JJ1773]|uniref:glucose 1-dehydrogenase n=1 Tax=Bacillus sp. JJ1773 TaxID=3122965 RepID=UPI002FFDCBCB